MVHFVSFFHKTCKMDYNETNQEQFGDFETREGIALFVREIIERSDPSITIENAVVPAAMSLGERIYHLLSKLVDHEEVAITMMLLGLMIGFEAGHEEGHICAEGSQEYSGVLMVDSENGSRWN